jgi:SAM-dependent methyltransferase
MSYLYAMKDEWFSNWFNTPYYHTLYKNRNTAEASAFVNRLLRYLSPPGDARILDLACGSGRHAIELASKGYDVTGIDLSPESIRIASLSESDNLHFFIHDMRNIFRTRYYQYIFNFFTSFGYFERASEDQRAMRAISSGLVEGGTLVIDYLNVVRAVSQLVPKATMEIDGIQFNIERKADDRFIYKYIEVMDKPRNETHHFMERVSILNYQQFEHLLADAGLTLLTAFGSYALDPFDAATSDRLILIAQRTN